MNGYQGGVGFLIVFAIVIACYFLWDPMDD